MSTTTDTRPIATDSDFTSIENGLRTVTTDQGRINKARRSYNAGINSNLTHHAAGRQAISVAVAGMANPQPKISKAQKAAGVTVADERAAYPAPPTFRQRAANAAAALRPTRPTPTREVRETPVTTQTAAVHEEVHENKPPLGIRIVLALLGGFLGFLVGWIFSTFFMLAENDRNWGGWSSFIPLVHLLLFVLFIAMGVCGGLAAAYLSNSRDEVEVESNSTTIFDHGSSHS